MKKLMLAIPLLLCYNTGYSGNLMMNQVSDNRGGFVQCVNHRNSSNGISCNWDRYNKTAKVSDAEINMFLGKLVGSMSATSEMMDRQDSFMKTMEKRLYDE